MSRIRRLLALALCLLPPTLAPRAVAAPLARWSFDGCATVDSVAGRDLTPHGTPSCISGASGSGWSFDGATQYLERGTESVFRPGGGAWSVAVWVKRSPGPAPDGAVVSWYRCGSNPACTIADAALWSIWEGSGRALWYVRDDNAVSVSLLDSTVNIADGQWHHVVGTLSAAHDSLKLYIDGARRKAVAQALGSLTGSATLEVGRWFRVGWGQPDYYYAGNVDDVRIYTHELTASEVAALSGAPTTGAPAHVSVGFALERIGSNPVRASSLRLAFTTASDAPVRVALIDLLGREVAVDAIERPAIGRNELAFEGHGAFPPGVYFARATQGASAATLRVTLLR